MSWESEPGRRARMGVHITLKSLTIGMISGSNRVRVGAESRHLSRGRSRTSGWRSPDFRPLPRERALRHGGVAGIMSKKVGKGEESGVKVARTCTRHLRSIGRSSPAIGSQDLLGVGSKNVCLGGTAPGEKKKKKKRKKEKKKVGNGARCRASVFSKVT